MILEKQTQARVLQTGQNNESIGMSLDLDSAQVLMQMLSKNLYSDAIGSTVRECASNALDSHRRAGVTKPIIVSLVRNDSDNYEFSVEDFGTGLDNDDVQNIISKYGKSTKRSSNNELGMFGLGFKAPLAYSSSFYFVCRKDGIERKYMMYEGEDTNTIDLLDEKVTNEGNGVKVIVPVKWTDKYDFNNKIREQLSYFENVYFNVDAIDNNFSIHRTKIFQFSELSSDKNLHICLDDVYYPLDFQKMGIDKIEIPVGLRFGLSDGLFPTPNRESLIYSQEAKKVIKSKLTEFANYMAHRYNDSVSGENNDIGNILKYYTTDRREIRMFNSNFDYNDLKEFATVKLNSPKIEGIDTLRLDAIPKYHFNYLLSDYKVNWRVENNRMYKVENNHWHRTLKWSSVLSNSTYYRMDNVLKGNKKTWLREKAMDIINNSYGVSRMYYFKRMNSIKLGNRNSTGHDNYYEILDLKSYPKSEWRQVIKDWLKIEDMILSNVRDFTNEEVPKDWLDARKAKIASKSLATKSANGTYKKLQGEITFKKAVNLSRWSNDKNCKFQSNKKSIKSMIKSGITYIYDVHDNSSNLDELYKIVSKLPINLITFSKREMKLVESLDLQNFIHYDEFMKGEHVYFKKITTSYLIKKLEFKFSNLFINYKYLKDIKLEMYEDLDRLLMYKNSNLNGNSYDVKVVEKMLEVSEKSNLFDYKIHYLIQKYEKFLQENPFINYMFGSVSYRNIKGFNSVTCDLFKYHKIRVNIEYYLPKKEEEQTSEQ